MSAALELPPLPVMAEQHGQVAEWIAHMRAASDFLYGTASPSRLLALADYYHREVRPHFAYEERRLFPALRQLEDDPALHATLERFEDEHVQLLTSLDSLIENLRAVAAGDLNGPMLAQTSRRARLAIDLLLLHAAQEDDVLLPLIEKHAGRLD